jgi:hypothetical protein
MLHKLRATQNSYQGKLVHVGCNPGCRAHPFEYRGPQAPEFTLDSGVQSHNNWLGEAVAV